MGDDHPTDRQELIKQLGRRRAAELGVPYDPRNYAISAWVDRRLGIPPKHPTPPNIDRSVCICGLRGVVSGARKGAGPEIWRCEAHRMQWPDYAEDAIQRRRSDENYLSDGKEIPNAKERYPFFRLAGLRRHV